MNFTLKYYFVVLNDTTLEREVQHDIVIIIQQWNQCIYQCALSKLHLNISRGLKKLHF